MNTLKLSLHLVLHILCGVLLLAQMERIKDVQQTTAEYRRILTEETTMLRMLRLLTDGTQVPSSVQVGPVQ